MTQAVSVKADLVLVLVTLLAAAGWIFSKEALAGLAPLMFIFIRFVSAGVVVGAVGWKDVQAMSQAEWIRALRSGACFGMAIAFWIMGLKHGQHMGVGAFLTCLGVVMVPLVILLFGDRPPSTTWVSLPLAAAGLGCLSLDGTFVFGFGELCYLAAACLFALTFVLTTRAAASIPAIALTSVQLTVVGLVALPLSLAFETWQLPGVLNIWLWVLASTLIATCLRFFLQTWAQGKTSSSSAALIMMLEPVWTAFLAAFWFGEQMTLMQMLGCGLIFTALLASRWRSVIRVAGKLVPATARSW